MTDDPASSDEPDHATKEQVTAREEAARARDPALLSPAPSLEAFAAIQRHLASIDFSAIRATERAIEQSGAFKKMVDTQDAIAREFARSVDFSRLDDTYRALTQVGPAVQAMAAQQRWAESLASSIDFTALNNALASSAALESLARTSEAFNRSLREQTEFFGRIAEAVTFNLPVIDIQGLAVG
ncbi:MAG: hypothetical protein HY997_23640 [Mycolicibacterium neoaurum]|nr:hypothetical protein [Mycolicibacterium neoaurum]